MAMSTLGARDPAWRSRVDEIDAKNDVAFIGEVVRRAHRYAVLVLNGSLRRDQAIAAAISLHPKPPVMVVTDATWKVEDRSWEQRAQVLATKLIERVDTRYCVLSNFEKTRFPQTWGVDPDRVIVTPWMYTLSDEELAADVDDSGGIVSGGDSLRDYRALLDVAGALDAPVTIATRTLSAQDLERLAPNVTAGPLDPGRYDEVMRRAAITVVALEHRTDRSAGQGTYLNAMVRAKPVVVTDAPGVDDYVIDGKTGIIVRAGDRAGLRNALQWLLDHPGSARAMGALARTDVLDRFNPARYRDQLLALVESLA